jgi:hypothetical protein
LLVSCGIPVSLAPVLSRFNSYKHFLLFAELRLRTGVWNFCRTSELVFSE